MANFNISANTKKSPEEVFAFLADMTNASLWDPGVVSARRVDKGELAVGSQFEVALKAVGQQFTLLYSIAEYEAPNRVVLASENSFIITRDTITVDANEDGTTKVTYGAELSGKGLASHLEPLWKLAINTIGNHAAAGFKAQFTP